MNSKLIWAGFLIVWGIYLLAGLFWADHQRPSGDEPHYLIIAQSLIKDHDLDLKNNYDQKDYRAWGYPIETLDRHISPNSRAPFQYSIHNLGWPLIISPFLALADRLGVTFFVSLLAALLFLNIFLLLKNFFKNDWVALIISSVIGFSAPILIYSTQIFNEIFAALLIVYALRKIIEKEEIIGQILSLLAIAFLPWLHIKYLLISVVLIILWLIHNWGRQKIFLAVVYVISLGVLAYFFKHWYGSFSPNAQYPSTLVFDLPKIGQGMLALFLDQTFGLLIYAPVYSLVIAGLYFLYRENKIITFKLLVVFLSLFLIQAANATMIGWAPAGRFLVPVLPLLALPLAQIYFKLEHWTKVIFWHLAAWGWLVGYLLIRHPDLNYSLAQPQFSKAISPPIFDISKIFPHLLEVEKYPALDHQNIFLLSFWLILIVSFNLFLILKYRQTRH